jgi:hypothetical protein
VSTLTAVLAVEVYIGPSKLNTECLAKDPLLTWWVWHANMLTCWVRRPHVLDLTCAWHELSSKLSLAWVKLKVLSVNMFYLYHWTAKTSAHGFRGEKYNFKSYTNLEQWKMSTNLLKEKRYLNENCKCTSSIYKKDIQNILFNIWHSRYSMNNLIVWTYPLTSLPQRGEDK